MFFLRRDTNKFILVDEACLYPIVVILDGCVRWESRGTGLRLPLWRDGIRQAWQLGHADALLVYTRNRAYQATSLSRLLGRHGVRVVV